MSAAQQKRCRVVINGLHAKTGGGVTYLRNILPFLAANPQLECHLFLHEDQYELFGDPPDGLHLHLLEFRPGFLRLLMWEQVALPYLARAMGARVVFSPANYGPLLGPRGVILLRNSLAVMARESRAGKRAYWRALAAATMASLFFCRRAIAVSHYAKQALSFRAGFLARKVEVVHHGVDPIFTPPEGERDDGGYVLAVSDIYVQKNLHGLIRAWEKVAVNHPGVELWIVGREVDKDYLDEVRSLIAAAGLTDRVRFLGGRKPEELLDLYRRCRLFVFPSTVETFGNPLVEAMACGAPVASSNTAAMPEIVGDAAVMFDPCDLAEMADKISGLLADPQWRADIGMRGRARAAQYSWQATAERTAAILLAAAAD